MKAFTLSLATMLTGLAAAQSTSLYGVKVTDGHSGTGWSWQMNGQVITSPTQVATASVASAVVGRYYTSANSTLLVDWTIKIVYAGNPSPTEHVASTSSYYFTRGDRAYATSQTISHGEAWASVGSSSASVDVYMDWDEDWPVWSSTNLTGSLGSVVLTHDSSSNTWIGTKVLSTSSFSSDAILYGNGYKLDDASSSAEVKISGFQNNVIVNQP